MQSVILFVFIASTAHASLPMYVLPEVVVTAQRDTSISYILPETVVTAKRPSGNTIIEDGGYVPPTLKSARISPFQGLAVPINIAHAEPVDMNIIAGAQTFGGDFTVEKNDTVDEDVTVSGGNADIQGYIDGDLAVLGGTVDITGIVNGDVAVMGGSLDLYGEVTGDAAVFGGNIENKGKIAGDIFVMGGMVELDSGSVVEGDIASIGGEVRKDTNAIVMGSTKAVEAEALEKYLPRIGKIFKIRNLVPKVKVFTGFLSTAPMVVAFLLSLLILVIFPKAVDRIINILQTDFWVDVAVGIGSEVAYVPALFLMAVSIIGIPLIPLFMLAVFVAILFGFSALAIVLGERVCKNLNWHVTHRIGIFCIGWLALMIIPLLGILFSALGFIGVILVILGLIIIYIEITITLGAAIYSIFKKA